MKTIINSILFAIALAVTVITVFALVGGLCKLWELVIHIPVLAIPCGF